MNSQIITIMVIVIVSLHTTPGQELLKKRLNYGVFLKRENIFQLSTDRWFHTFKFQIVPPIWNNLNHTKPAMSCNTMGRRPTTNETLACRERVAQVNSFHLMQTKAYKRINHLMFQIDSILTGRDTLSPLTSRKRSLFPVIGAILHYGFGLSRDEDRERVEEHLKRVTLHMVSMTGTIHMMESRLLSATQIVNDRVTAVNTKMDLQQSAIRQLAEALERNTMNELDIMRYAWEMSFNLTSISEELKYTLQGLQHLTTGSFDQEIVTKPQLSYLRNVRAE